MRKPQIGLDVCWILMRLSFLWPFLPVYWMIHSIKLADIRMLVPLLYTVIVIMQGIVIGRGPFLQKKWAIYCSLVSTAIAFIFTVPDFVQYLFLVIRENGFDWTKGDSPLAFISYLLLGAPVAIGTLLYITSLVIWWKRARQLARYAEVQASL